MRSMVLHGRSLAGLAALMATLVGCDETYMPVAYPQTTVAYYDASPTPLPPVAQTEATGAPPPPPPRTQRFLQTLPPYRDTAQPTNAELIARWQLPPSNLWARYQKMTLFTALDSTPRTAPMPDISQLDVVARARRAAECLAGAGLPNDTMWIVDLRGAASVAFGATLSAAAREPVSLVATFNNWPAERELIPADETLAALVAFTPRLPDPRALTTRPVFMLDAWRLAFRGDHTEDDVTDNRYMLGPTDLPDASTLRARGITRIAYMVESRDDAANEEDDLYAVFRAYQAAGITLVLMDLDVCAQPVARGRIDEVFVSRTYICLERRTILDDPWFYRRAHGGFGGVYAGPVYVGGGGPHYGGGGG
jgi:hypothetical protein